MSTQPRRIFPEEEIEELSSIARYEITSYGADYDVEGLVRRLIRGDILIPPFQRNYVWKQKEASRFIESLLLGLPVPGIFLASERSTNRFLVIDGQQRLKSLQFFYEGFFKPEDNPDEKKVFKLINVAPQFLNKTYETLEVQDKLKLDNSFIHATIVKQESPADDDTSIYYIFDRLNSEGRRLTPQEIRTAVGHGKVIDLIKELNAYPIWRSMYGPKSDRLNDQELILRFFALFYWAEYYRSPMREFLDKFLQGHKNPDDEWLLASKTLFHATIDIAWRALGKQAFRRGRSFNAAIFDSVSVGIATRLARSSNMDEKKIESRYNSLFEDEGYNLAITRATANEKNLALRVNRAKEAFSDI